ncbi:hypothetical protein [Rubripirellula amarantea]|uniref:hypothetical protein n=1 Tax=Rubripirellula amarantea TaxID=2527999 RepID=UPI0011B7ED72|nr:hypothetical protein [Rubripirellula amarantea]
MFLQSLPRDKAHRVTSVSPPISNLADIQASKLVNNLANKLVNNLANNRCNTMAGTLTHVLASTLFLVVGFFTVLPAANAQTGTPTTNQGAVNLGTGLMGGVEPSGQYPSQQYYLGLQTYRSGDLDQAVDVLESALRSSRRDINGRWIDAIPSLAMLGECYWHLGDLETSKQYVDQVGQIAIRYEGWLSSTDFQSALQQNTLRTKPRWLWADATAVSVLSTASKLSLRSGQQVTENSLRAGGIIEEPSLRSMDIIEIMRTLAVASHRRRVILGPLSKNEPMAEGVLQATKFPANLQIPIARSLIGSMRTAGYFASLNDKRVVEEANRSASLPGGVHPITPIAMHCKAWTLASQDKPEEAFVVSGQMANIAAALEQPEWVGEAMQLAAGCAVDAKSASMVAQLSGMAANAMMRESRLGALHCLIAAADASLTAGDSGSARQFLSQASTLSSRRDVLLPRLDAYGAYVAARLASSSGASVGSGNATDADKAIQSIRDFAFQHRNRKRSLVSMPRLFQLSVIRLALGSSLGGRTGGEFLRSYCDDPPVSLWRQDPVDAISITLADKSSAHTAQVAMLAESGYAEELLVAADSMLASRFLQRMPLGGRLVNLRALVSMDANLLPADAAQMRLKGGPMMNDLAVGAGAANAGMSADAIESLEAKATTIALQRLQIPNVAMPRLDTEKPIAMLPSRTAMLMFVAVGNKVNAVLAADGKVIAWEVKGANRLPGEIGAVLRGMGVGKPRGKRIDPDDRWRQAAVSLRQRLLPDDNAISEDRFDHLIIIPDGPLWYLPFEALPLTEKDSSLLGEKIFVSYAPTPGMGLHHNVAPATNTAIGLATQKFFSPRDPVAEQTAVDSIVGAIENVIRLPEDKNLPTSLLGDDMGSLVVASAQGANIKSPLLTQVASYDQGSPAGTLAAWLRFPTVSPRNVVAMGMRTAIDYGQMGDGSEIFTTLCALHVSGVRNILMARWAVGGESSAILLRELVQEIPYIGLDDSWSRAIAVLRDSTLDPTAEPLLTKAEQDLVELKGSEPLFWAGYLLSSPLKHDLP